MSHLPERSEKNCLNCNARVYGRYCHICGQQNLEPNESLWHLITHFFNDITHFDGKFFSTLKLLITKPGFLPGEYKRGRRTSYLNPVRMYIFTSFAFFLIFFSIADSFTFGSGKSEEDIQKMDSASFSNYTAAINKGKPMTREEYKIYKDSMKPVSIMGDNYRDKKQYDSLKDKGVIHPNWLQNRFNYQNLKIREKYGNDNGKAMEATIKVFIHNFPQILFVSLPLFAFFLWLIYIRNKDFYFVAHGIYGVHLYIFYFISLLAMMGLSWLGDRLGGSWTDYLIFALFVGLLIYEYKAMRYFYQQRRAKTVLKFLLVLTWRFVIFLVLFVAFFVFSFLKI